MLLREYILCVLLQSWIQHTAFAIPISKNLDSVQVPVLNQLCVDTCTCGTFRHPFEAAVRDQTLFVAFPSSTSMVGGKSLGKLNSLVQPNVNLLYPVSVLFCRALEVNRIPQFIEPVLDGPDTELEESFFTKLTVLIMRQGRLKEVLRDNFYPFRNTLEYIDLSYNRITYIAPDALLDLIMLQEIDLRFNNLKQLGGPLWSTGKNYLPFVAVGSNRKFLTSLRLRGNPITCSCGLARTIILHVIIPIDDGSTCTFNTSMVKNNVFMTSQFNIAEPSAQLRLSRLTCATDRDDTNSHREARPPMENFPHQTHESRLTESHQDLTKWVMRSLTPSQRHHIADAKLNISVPRGGDEEHYEDHSNVVHRVYKSKGDLDIPLLVTMTAWFLMIYFGIVRFIKANALDHDQHLNYLKLEPPNEESSDTESNTKS